jgi:uncharacterized membrane protein
VAYGLLVLAMFLAAVIPTPWVIGLVVVVPLVVISTYAGYREVFEAAKTQ